MTVAEAPEVVAYKPAQVAEMLQVSTDTVYRLIRSGRLRKLDLGSRTTRIADTEVDRFKREG